jgi:hypothetical protein
MRITSASPSHSSALGPIASVLALRRTLARGRSLSDQRFLPVPYSATFSAQWSSGSAAPRRRAAA